MHFATKAGLYFWKSTQILRILIPIDLIFFKNNCLPFVLNDPKSVQL
jgi:hypothetical protein